jgi:ankyrin repeat protein
MNNTINIEVATQNIIDEIDNIEENTLVEQLKNIKDIIFNIDESCLLDIDNCSLLLKIFDESNRFLRKNENLLIEVFRILLERNQHLINLKNKNNETLLHFAIEKECIDLAVFLIRNNADPGVKDKWNNTALKLITDCYYNTSLDHFVDEYTIEDFLYAADIEAELETLKYCIDSNYLFDLVRVITKHIKETFEYQKTELKNNIRNTIYKLIYRLKNIKAAFLHLDKDVIAEYTRILRELHNAI